jgi:ABC-type branched-subunit amino acid transport system substrate-binding protein
MRSHRAAAVLLLPLLMLVACGSRLSDKERDEAIAAGGAAASGTGSADGGSSGDSSGDATTTTAAGAKGAGGSSTGATTPGGAPASGPSTGAGAAACKSSGKASDTGVSATEIKIGNLSTIGGPVPGFGQTGRNGVRAYVAKVNAEGGVCGRKLTIVPGDDRLDAGANKSETERLVKVVFAFVGDTTVTDDGGAGSLGNTPDVSLSISDARIKAPTNFSTSPIDLSTGGNGTEKIFGWFKANKGVKSGAIIYPGQASARNRAAGYQHDMEAAGIPLGIPPKEVSITETNYSGFAADVASKKIDIVITALEVNGMARLARAFDTQGYTPTVPFYGAQAYGKKFITSAGAAANGTLIGAAYAVPEASGSPAIKELSTWYSRANGSADLDYFAIQGWVAADMFVTALRSAGADPTRDKVLAELRKQTSYDGGGLVGNINPAQKKFAKCFTIIGVTGGKWSQVFPKSGFQC